MIQLEHISKSFVTASGTVHAVQDVNLQIGEGEIFGIIGFSGAGKSTLVRCINLLERPTEGRVIVDGVDLTAMDLKKLREVRKKIGMIFQHFNLMRSRTVFQNIAFPLKKSGLSKAEKEKKIESLLELVGLSDKKDAYPSQLSGGQKQRVAIAGVMAMKPECIILDEPTVGLDPKQIIEIRTLIKNLGRNHTVILSSHILPEVQAVCERIIVINNGRVVADGATDTLAHDLSPDHRLILRAEGPEKEMVHALQNVPGVVDTYSLGEKEKGVYDLSVESTPDNDIRRDVFALMARKGWPILALKNTDLTLEDLFLQLTSSDASLLQQQEDEDEDEGGNHLDLDQDLDLEPDAGQEDAKEKETEKGGDAE